MSNDWYGPLTHWFIWPFKRVLKSFRRIFNDFYPKIRPEVDWKLPEKQVKNPPKNLPEAFPEYPEVANKPVRQTAAADRLKKIVNEKALHWAQK